MSSSAVLDNLSKFIEGDSAFRSCRHWRLFGESTH